MRDFSRSSRRPIATRHGPSALSQPLSAWHIRPDSSEPLPATAFVQPSRQGSLRACGSRSGAFWVRRRTRYVKLMLQDNACCDIDRL